MRVRRLIQIGPEGWVALLRAQLAILRAHRAVRSSETGPLTGAGVDGVRLRPSRPVTAEERARAELLAWAVDVTARRGFPRAECLVRSLALANLLSRSGLPPGRIRVGVRERRRMVEAHAWVEWGGCVLGDHPATVASFRPFGRLEVRFPPAPVAGRPS